MRNHMRSNEYKVLKMLLNSTKLQFVMRNSKIYNFQVKVPTPFLNCVIKLCSYEKNRM